MNITILNVINHFIGYYSSLYVYLYVYQCPPFPPFPRSNLHASFSSMDSVRAVESCSRSLSVSNRLTKSSVRPDRQSILSFNSQQHEATIVVRKLDNMEIGYRDRFVQIWIVMVRCLMKLEISLIYTLIGMCMRSVTSRIRIC